MDKLSVVGIVLALIAVIGGAILKGAGAGALISPAAFTIVILGTLASIFLHTPPATFLHGMKIAKWVIMPPRHDRSEEHTSELQSLMRISYAVFCLTKQKSSQQREQKTHPSAGQP